MVGSNARPWKSSGRPAVAEDAAFALITCTRRHVWSGCSCYGRGMSRPDLNLLVTLDVLLAEGNVARAARRD
ncbi:MAG: hypothetical protein IJI03_16695, partial [Rudaea sp.]|nr:hypothetical protein [Rudaea sp.]